MKLYLAAEWATKKKNGRLEIEPDGFFREKLKDYQRVDVKMSYRLNKLRSTHSFFIAADNVLNRKNVLGKAYYYYEQQMKTDYQLGLFPYAGYKIEF